MLGKLCKKLLCIQSLSHVESYVGMWEYWRELGGEKSFGIGIQDNRISGMPHGP